MKPISYLYPNGGTRAITFSYDDGTEYDRRLADIFDRNGLRATFHLNAGTLDKPGYLSAAELQDLFRNHEIAAHTLDHPYPSMQPGEVMLPQIIEDRKQLEAIAKKPVRGFSYPFGDHSGDMLSITAAAGIDYARTVSSHGGFFLPDNFLLWNPTCHHDEALNKWKAFTAPYSGHKLALMYVWGHSFEFERHGNWSMIEDFCQVAGAEPGIWFATNCEIMEYILAMRRLKWSVEGSMVFNPSAIGVYLEKDENVCLLSPGLNYL